MGDGKRALVESMTVCYKTLLGPRLCAWGFAAQHTKVAISVVALNRLRATARPHFCPQTGENRLTDCGQGELPTSSFHAPTPIFQPTFTVRLLYILN